MADSGFQLRPAGGNDLDATYALYAEVQAMHAEALPAVFRRPEKDAAFQRHFETLLADPDQHLVLASRDGALAGFVQFFMGRTPESFFRRERRLAYINALAVVAAYRRTGCARFLIDHVKHEARRHGIADLEIDTYAFNHAALACFEKAGFAVRKQVLWQEM